MSLILFDGFDYLDNSLSPANLELLLLKGSFNYAGNCSLNTGRFNYGYCLRINPGSVYAGGGWSRQLKGSHGTLYFGMAFQHFASTGNPPADFDIILWDSTVYNVSAPSGAACLTVRLGAGGTVSVFDATTTRRGVTAGNYTHGAWSYIEIYYKKSTGVLEVRIDTVPVFAGTGLNLTPTGGSSTGADTLKVERPYQNYINYTPGPLDIDDFYVLDSAGSANNSWLGDVRVQLQLPEANGGHLDFTRSNIALFQYQNVLNAKQDDSLYVFSGTAGNYDLYDAASLVNNPPVYGVGVRGSYRQTDATARFVQNTISSSGVLSYGASTPVTQSFANHQDIWELDPNTGAAWNPTAVNAVLIGPKVNV